MPVSQKYVAQIINEDSKVIIVCDQRCSVVVGEDHALKRYDTISVMERKTSIKTVARRTCVKTL